MTSPMSCSTMRTVIPDSRIRPMSRASSAVSRMLSPAAGSSRSRSSRVRGEGAGELHRALLAVGEARRLGAGEVRGADERERLPGAALRPRAPPPGPGQVEHPGEEPRPAARDGRPPSRSRGPSSARRAGCAGRSGRRRGRRWRAAAQPCTGAPRRSTVPASEGRTPETRLKSVVFPAPFGPMSALTRPLLDAERDVLHGLEAAEGLREAGHLEEAHPSAPGGRRRARTAATAARGSKRRMPSGEKSMTAMSTPPKTASSRVPK